MTKVQCQYCGELFQQKGIKSHISNKHRQWYKPRVDYIPSLELLIVIIVILYYGAEIIAGITTASAVMQGTWKAATDSAKAV
jgi:hypothetical protein